MRHAGTWMAIGLLAAVMAASLLPTLIGLAARNLGIISLEGELKDSGFRYHETLEARLTPHRVSRDQIEIALAIQPADARSLRSLALTWLADGDLDRARDLLAEYAGRAPNDRTTAVFLGEIAYAMGDVRSAIATWSASPSGLFLAAKASQALEDDNRSAAVLLLKAAQAGGPPSDSLGLNLAEQYGRLAERYRELGDETGEAAACDDGASAYKMALSSAPDLGFARVNYGVLLRRCERPNEAIAQLLTIDDSFAPTIQAWADHEIGLTYLELGTPESAVPYFEHAVALAAALDAYRFSLARAYEQAGDRESAATQFTILLNSSDEKLQSQAKQALDRLK
jgi:tetratricopeptide (TPR) repeat protein